jgi:hypothetical protein
MAHSQKGKTAAKSIKQQERATHALNLRRAGASYAEIGKALGVTKQRAFAIVKTQLDELAATVNEASTAVRQLELERLDAMQIASFQKAVRGETAAVDTVLRIMDRRAKLLGLNAPSELEITEHPKHIVIDWVEADRADADG